MKILAFSGSLSEKSLNTAMLRAAKELLPAGWEMEIISLDLPLFNRDLEANLPPEVQAFKEKVKAADALLIASPEYNYSISGVLKNAVDWGSRPWGHNCFSGKPGAILGVSNGQRATARSYYDAHKIFAGLNVLIPNYPQFLLGEGQTKVDEHLRLVDEETKTKLKAFIDALIDWTMKLKQVGIAK